MTEKVKSAVRFGVVVGFACGAVFTLLMSRL